MAYPKLSGKEFNALLPLLLKQPWLEERYDAYQELLGLCLDESQKALVHSLLDRFSYLDDQQLDLILRAIVSQVFDTWKFPRGQTQFPAPVFSCRQGDILLSGAGTLKVSG